MPRIRQLAAAALLLAPYWVIAGPQQVSPDIPEAPECSADAASFHGVNEWVLRAIIWHESGNRSALVTTNPNKSNDIGLGGINTVHLPELGLYGVTREHLTDACINTYTAAWLLAKKIAKHGDSWEAIGAYHSETPQFKWAYANRIRAVLLRWRIPF